MQTKIKSISSKSREFWNCRNCTFMNSKYLNQCEVCSFRNEQSKLQNSIFQLEPQKNVSKRNSSEDYIICENCTFKNKLESTLCEICGITIFQNQRKKISSQQISDLIKCNRCNFQNNKSYITCLSCENLLSKQLPPQHIIYCLDCSSINTFQNQFCSNCHKILFQIQKINEPQLNQCPICSNFFEKSQFQNHLNNCKKLLDLEENSKCIRCNQYVKSNEMQNHKIKCIQNLSKQINDNSFERMTKLQISCLNFMQEYSKKQHFRQKLPLLTRLKKLNFNSQDLQNLHHYIENYAPIIVHIHVNKHLKYFIQDTHYRNQFQTGKSSGTLNKISRIGWEDRMFFKKYKAAKDFQRVKYGTINFTNDPKGVNSCKAYGSSYLLLKTNVKQRCTLTNMDSSSSTSLIGTFKFCFHILNKLTDGELKAAINAAKANQISSNVVATYKQIQIHGPIEFSKDVDKLYVNKAQLTDPIFMKQVEQFSKKFKVDYEIFN